MWSQNDRRWVYPAQWSNPEGLSSEDTAKSRLALYYKYCPKKMAFFDDSLPTELYSLCLTFLPVRELFRIECLSSKWRSRMLKGQAANDLWFLSYWHHYQRPVSDIASATKVPFPSSPDGPNVCWRERTRAAFILTSSVWRTEEPTGAEECRNRSGVVRFESHGPPLTIPRSGHTVSILVSSILPDHRRRYALTLGGATKNYEMTNSFEIQAVDWEMKIGVDYSGGNGSAWSPPTCAGTIEWWRPRWMHTATVCDETSDETGSLCTVPDSVAWVIGGSSGIEGGLVHHGRSVPEDMCQVVGLGVDTLGELMLKHVIHGAPYMSGHSAWRIPGTNLIVTFGGLNLRPSRCPHSGAEGRVIDVCNTLRVFDAHHHTWAEGEAAGHLGNHREDAAVAASIPSVFRVIGSPPPARYNQASALVGHQQLQHDGGGGGGVVGLGAATRLTKGETTAAVWGGWTKRDRPNVFFNDLHLVTMAWRWTATTFGDRQVVVQCAWSSPTTYGVPPCPRAQAAGWFSRALESGGGGCGESGMLFIFGGASHTTNSDTYGSLVVDHADLHCLDMSTHTWLPVAGFTDDSDPTKSLGHALRGGVNAVAVMDITDDEEVDSLGDLYDESAALGKAQGRSRRHVYISGGMHSEYQSNMPDFLTERVEVKLNTDLLGFLCSK